MRRGNRGNWKRPHQTFGGRPPGLRGKEIGLYYKNKQMKKNQEQLSLEVPQAILAALQTQMVCIEDIARKENIYIPPQERLEFIEPNSTLFSSDYKPIDQVKSENQLHTISNLIPRDYDVMVLKNKPICIKKEDNENEKDENVIKSNEQSISGKKLVDDKNEITLDNSDAETKQIQKVVVKNEEYAIKQEYSINNKYTPSTSDKDKNIDKNDFKYGYNDIITGTFEEKLNESIAKGININKKTTDILQLNSIYMEEYNHMKESKGYKNMMKFRETLPAYKKAKDLLKVVHENQVIVISGETGCGKSTQVPQIILDDALKNKTGANVKILVTQPRRIAASSLALRVADERGEKLGNAIGYTVRLESVECRQRASIMFCTTGVLLVEMEVDQSLSNYSHIILDEVHERDCQVDISMCMLKMVLKKRKDLKLILMSATIDADTLCAYYDGCPMLHIEGLAFPVQDIYLEQILQMTKYQMPPVEERIQNKRHGRPWMQRKGGGRAAQDMENDVKYRAEIAPWLESVKKSLDKDVYKTLQDRRIEELNIDLIFELLLCITKGDRGAILVFLPGIAEITKLVKKMHDSRQFPDSQYDIHPLHSKLPTLTQHKIFKKPPGTKRKIIVATNIAETSITIDDIVYVVDCAKIKYSGLNVEDHVSTLKVEWASQANLRQRRGRAGRCQPGICYHLVSSYRATQLPERLLPELERNSLLEPVLQIKRLRLGFAEQALNMMPSVPDEKTIKNAVRHLQQCGALDEKETLTPLGWHLARLPVHPAAGKLLLLGALFGCLERAASVAAVWGFKDPFQLVIGKEAQVDAAKKNLALGEPSDHIAISEALMQWERSGSQKYMFARDYFLSHNTLQLLSEMKKQFGYNLKQMGFLQSGDVKATWQNRNTDNLSLFKAIIAASLYPNIGTVRWFDLKSRNPNKTPRIKIRTPEDNNVSVHPSSVMATKREQKSYHQPIPLCSNPGANWLVYWLKQKSLQLYLIDVTLVYTLPLLFFGELHVTQAERSSDCLIEIKSIKVRCALETTQLLYRLRSLLDQVLASKIMVSSNGKRTSLFEEMVLTAVSQLITAEDAQTQYLGDDDDQSGSEDYNDRRNWR